MQYSIKVISGHVEVYTQSGEFVFSADSQQEALQEIDHMEAA